MKYEYWFANIHKIMNKRKREIKEVINEIQALYYIEETALKHLPLTEEEVVAVLESRAVWDIEGEWGKLVEKGITFVPNWSDMFPKRLRELSAPPYALYVKGRLPEEERASIAIVGARECSPYGEAMAREIAQALVREGVQIISGMARGIDSVGQRAALASGGESYAVLGCGVDICYPREAIELYMQLQEQGGIISEFAPQTAPTASHFPARNRIISGMSDAVIVIEAKERSGSLITADMALEQGKDVYALPGPINSRLSAGCNRLIHQGAGIILNTEELLKDLGFISEVRNAKKKQKKLILETTENLVYSSLDLTPKSLDMILNETKMTVSDLLDVLMQLQLRGFIREISKNYYTIVEE